MTTKPVTTNPTTTIQDAARLMTKFDVGSVLIQEQEEVIGIVTEYDLTRKVVANNRDTTEPVENIMEETMTMIEPDRDVTEALQMMNDNDIRHLPVGKDGKLNGLITMKDILKIEPELFELVVEKIRLREENRKPIATVVGEEGMCESCGNYAEILYEVNGSMICRKCRAQAQ